MLTHADRTREQRRRSATTSVSQRQGPGEPAIQLVDNRPGVADLRRQQETINGRSQVRQLNALQEMANHRSVTPTPPVQRHTGSGAESGAPVQMKPREARVAWAITHLVQVQGEGENESLFGNQWNTGEVPPEKLGQLSNDQLIEVDDAKVFMSRRGPNQEDPKRRSQDAEADELRYEWLKVLRIHTEDGWKEPPKDAYVRAETIKFTGARDLQKIKVKEQTEEEDVSTDLENFYEAWQQAARNRRRSVGHVKDVPKNVDSDDSDEFVGGSEAFVVGLDESSGGPDQSSNRIDITSGWNWDKFDEGVNVSGSMKDPNEREVFEGVRKQQVLSANYDTESAEPAAYMVLEERDDLNKENKGQPIMYIRWLIGHPERGGGASALINKAIEAFEQSKFTMLRVDSAFSAVGWYKGKGFRELDPKKKVVEKGVGYGDTELVYTKKS